MPPKSKKQALFFVKQLIEFVDERKGNEALTASLKALQKELEREVLEEES